VIEYIVTVDFGDRTAPNVRTFDTSTALSGYLETIPNKLGFELNGGADINIRMGIKQTQPRLI
jgi:hypothetical protein